MAVVSEDNKSATPVQPTENVPAENRFLLYKSVLLDNVILQSNFIIHESQSYIGRKVYRFAIASNVVLGTYAASLAISFVFIFIHLLSAVIGLIFMCFWLLLNLQHLFVICYTLPVVLKLPRVTSDKYQSAFQMDSDDVTDEFAGALKSGIGIKCVYPHCYAFYALSSRGVLALRLATAVSLVMLCLTLVVTLGCSISLCFFAIDYNLKLSAVNCSSRRNSCSECTIPDLCRYAIDIYTCIGTCSGYPTIPEFVRNTSHIFSTVNECKSVCNALACLETYKRIIC